MMVISTLFVPRVLMAQYTTTGSPAKTTTTQKSSKSDKSGSGGGYSITGVPLEFSGSIRRPFNIGAGIQLSNGTAKNLMDFTLDVGINFRGKQFLGVRAMYQPVKWFAVGLFEYITFGQNMSVGYGFETGDLFGFSFMSRNTFALRTEFSLPIPLRGDVPYAHKFTLYLEPFGVYHDRYSGHDWSTPKQHYEIGLSYTYAIPIGGGKSSKK